jgi:hypothetical protein
MIITELNKILEAHVKWHRGEEGGSRANLSRADLSRANLSGADLSGANLSGANLRDADLSDADLSRANLSRANLSGANLRGANLSDADLSRADLSRANLSDADLSGANLSRADLSRADLSRANLSGAKNILSTIDYLAKTFEATDAGYIVYKRFGSSYRPPESWTIEPGSIIEEVVSHDRCRDCACGVNVGTLEWVKIHTSANDGPIWKGLIEWPWLAGVCVPYHTDGKIRAERVKLLDVLDVLDDENDIPF